MHVTLTFSARVSHDEKFIWNGSTEMIFIKVNVLCISQPFQMSSDHGSDDTDKLKKIFFTLFC